METFSRVRPGLDLANLTEHKRSDYNRRLWNSGIEDDKQIVRDQKRKLNYISNIYVIKDPANPDNEGQVFLYRYGKRIFDKIKEKMEPEFEDETPQNIFDFWEGSNFRLKIMNKDGYRNYDRSVFDEPSPLFDSDDDIAAIWEKEHALQEFVDKSNFKTYDEIKERLDTVMGFDTKASELYRPGDVVKSTPQQHETAEKKVHETLDNKKDDSEEYPAGFEPQKKETKSSSDDDDEDYFEDLASKL